MWVKGPYLQGAVPSVYSKVAVYSLAEAARPRTAYEQVAVLQAKGATAAKPVQCSMFLQKLIHRFVVERASEGWSARFR